MGREFKAIFFDLDGTLVDIHGPLYSAARNALDELGQQPPLTRERYLEAIASEDPWLGVPEPMRADYVKLAFAYLITELDRTERLEILPHVHETLNELKRRGYALGIVTSRPGAAQRLIEKLSMVGLAAYFNQVVTQEVASLRALDKTESLRHAAMHASVLPHACMYVGDEPRDVMAGIGAGFGATVAVATGPASMDLLRKHPLYRPDFLINSMAGFVDLLDRLKYGDG
ncbi:MAG: HAD family hydrolase [Deltaproteobacteria bacterium]|nr:HAD family hydrolase [Deltaproteobacteria bacterium]